MNQAYDPRRMGRVLHLAMEEILGTEGARSLLGVDGNSAGNAFLEGGRFSTARLAHVFSSLEQRYGESAGKGLAQRIGRACFRFGLREYGKPLGLTTTSFRLLPFPSKLKTFATAVAGMFNSIAGECVRVEEADGKLRWHMVSCPFCQTAQASHAICLLPVGLAEEALYWLSGGKMFSVEEIACVARGDGACTVQVDEAPLS